MTELEIKNQYCNLSHTQLKKVLKELNMRTNLVHYFLKRVGSTKAVRKAGKRTGKLCRTGNDRYDTWRRAVYSRDNYTCKMCGKTDMQCHAHHVYSKKDFPHLAFLPDNGITLCETCHLERVHKNKATCEPIEQIKEKLNKYAWMHGYNRSYWPKPLEYIYNLGA